jgi:hypothetical protein
MKTPPLPAKWSYKKPFLKDEEGYERAALDKSGKLARLYVASVLENYGYPEHAAAWRGAAPPDPLTDDTRADAVGRKIAEALSLKEDREEKGRYRTTWGTKTPAGLARTLARFLSEA